MCIAGFGFIGSSIGSDDRAERDVSEAEITGTGEPIWKNEMADEWERRRLGTAVVC